MKKFTLLILLMLLGITGVNAKQTVILKGNKALGKWATNLIIDKSAFENVSANDVIYVRWNRDEKGAEDAKEIYYQLSMSYGDWSGSIVNSYDAARVNCYAHKLTADEVTAFKAKGMAISGHFINITQIEISNSTTKDEIQYWKNDAWTTAAANNIDFTAGWGSAALNNDNLKNCSLGDVITVEFTPIDGLDEDWKAQVKISLNPNSGEDWIDLISDNVAYKTSLSLVVDASNHTDLTTGDIRLQGNKVTITSITLETADYRYHLDASNSNVDVSVLPTSEPIDIELYRKFDWNSTICLPFDVTNLSVLPEGIKVYEFKEYNEGLVFTEREHISAGVPYYMERPYDAGKSEEQKYSTIILDDVTISTTLNDSEESNGLTFKGNYTPAMNMEGKYGVGYVSGWGFYKGGSGSNLNAFSAYFDGTYVSPARLAIRTVDSITGVEEVKGVEEQRKDDNIYYNLSGQRVANPSNGIYILNGKKVIVR